MSDNSDQESCCPIPKYNMFKQQTRIAKRATTAQASDVSPSDVKREPPKGTDRKHPTPPLKRASIDYDSDDSLISIYDEEDDATRKYAITVNICPNKLMNKRKWKLYNHDQQRQILTRIEKASRVKNPIILEKLNFEVCPVLNQIHFHALYSMPSEFLSGIEAYYQRVIGMPAIEGDKAKEWRHIVTKPIFAEEGWTKYISKDEK